MEENGEYSIKLLFLLAPSITVNHTKCSGTIEHPQTSSSGRRRFVGIGDGRS
jgi:hypothetical protein